MNYILVRETLVETCSDPQVVEVQTVEGFVLYIRFKDGYLTCQEKWSGNYLCAGSQFVRALLRRKHQTRTVEIRSRRRIQHIPRCSIWRSLSVWKRMEIWSRQQWI